MKQLDALRAGLPYYDGKPCRYGHPGKRFTHNYQCADCGTNPRYAWIKIATPPWADKEKIKAIYDEAARTGLVVDHEIPLRGKLVCGLHVENNLQLLDSTTNVRKYNL
jgi:hypothetical protein